MRLLSNLHVKGKLAVLPDRAIRRQSHYFIYRPRLYFCLPDIINTMYIQYLGEIVPPPSQNTMGVCNQITLLILYYISSKLVTLLKVFGVPIPVPNIFYPTVRIKFLNFSFPICLFCS